MTFWSIKDKIEEENISLPCTYINEVDENVVLEFGCNNNGRFYRTKTKQCNNCIRINTFYEDGSIEEEYIKS